MPDVIDISRLGSDDRAGWEILARGYKTFYETVESDAAFEGTWRRILDGDVVHGIGARIDGTLVGIAHYLFHDTLWTGETCYLQDLFVDEATRGRGVARALIVHIAEEARVRGASRLYWTTKQDNVRARALYDDVAEFRGFIRYDRAVI